MTSQKIQAAFLGHAIGDALGVPVEFKSRESLQKKPVIDYLSYMCWNQPPGTFSDDSSMMFCTAESLCKGLDLTDIADNFVKWYQDGFWGAHNEVFDIGGTTKRSLDRIIKGESPEFSGEFFPENNGNGSLMRILPLIFFLKDEIDIKIRYKVIKSVSSITHAHFRSVFSCFIFVEYGIQLLEETDKVKALMKTVESVSDFAKKMDFNKSELELFDRILSLKIGDLEENQISSQGYVIDSLESAIWCFLKTENYKDSVLKSVNLGGDTDTTAAINGGLAGLFYGLNKIPDRWISDLARTNDIRMLAKRFSQKLK